MTALLNLQLPSHALERAQALMHSGRRALLGIAGTPGSGKSTVAHLLAAALGTRAVVVPMDGFHLANQELVRIGRQTRKGAPDTFDVDGYRAALLRLRACEDDIVYLPQFAREIEEPIANAIPVSCEVQLVITEGNYLLLPEGPWARIAELFDDQWYVEVNSATRMARLVERHQRYGRTRSQAQAWAETVDEPNACLIERYKDRADFVLPWD
ncbi:nucleoside/nucleotide kinase family protein [Pseudomonas japonica]|uniref:nucleoside/nucleotide kinase family protein n=1 Tax=Pseudomonas japonica TaxID=256466 RepID=UPI0015E29847|nr:nucleoside/nucleotide kinase family protein [Pseudomonas japonica]MBA1291418.1 nucleoside/nucleotide kinase family protein [Pseudomonas japonica]